MVPPASEMVDELRAEKMITVAAGDNVVRLLPPLIIGENEIAEAFARIDRACARLAKAHPRSAKAGGCVMTGNGVRHFLDLIDIPKPVLAGMIDDSRAMKAARDARRARRAARRQDAGDDLRQAVDAHARVVRRRHASAWRRSDLADRAGNAARPRRNAGRHRARAVALCRRHHDPHPRSRVGGRARAPRHRAGDQRPDPTLASLPGAGRRHDIRGKARADPRPHGGLDRRRQQRAGVLDACRRALRVPAAGGDAEPNSSPRNG